MVANTSIGIPIAFVTKSLNAAKCLLVHYPNYPFLLPPSFQGVFEVNQSEGLTLSEIADRVSVEDVKAATGCIFQVSGKPTWLCIFDSDCCLSLTLLLPEYLSCTRSSGYEASSLCKELMSIAAGF